MFLFHLKSNFFISFCNRCRCFFYILSKNMKLEYSIRISEGYYRILPKAYPYWSILLRLEYSFPIHKDDRSVKFYLDITFLHEEPEPKYIEILYTDQCPHLAMHNKYIGDDFHHPIPPISPCSNKGNFREAQGIHGGIIKTWSPVTEMPSMQIGIRLSSKCLPDEAPLYARTLPISLWWWWSALLIKMGILGNRLFGIRDAAWRRTGLQVK